MNAKDLAQLKEERRKGGFCRLSNAILRDPALSKNAKAVYALLCSYSGSKEYCYPSQARIAADMGGGIGMVKQGLVELERAGVIRWWRCTSRGDGRNRYELFDGFHNEHE